MKRWMQKPDLSKVIDKHFTCPCRNPITVLAEDRITHKCARPSQSYGMENTERVYVRNRVNPALTGGVEKYNWFAEWVR